MAASPLGHVTAAQAAGSVVAPRPASAAGIPADVSPARVGMGDVHGRTVAYARGTDGVLHWRHVDGPDLWRTVPGAIASGPDAVNTLNEPSGFSPVELYARGPAGDVLQIKQGTDGKFGSWASIGGAASTAPSAATLWNGAARSSLLVAVRGTDGRAKFRVRDFGVWGGWTDLGGTFTSAIEVTPDDSNGSFVLTGRGTGGRLWQNRIYPSSEFSKTWELVPSAPVVHSAVDRLQGGDLFYKTAAGTLAKVFLDTGKVTDLGGKLASGPAAKPIGDGEWYIGGQGTDGTLKVLHIASTSSSGPRYTWLNLGGTVS